MNKATHQPIVSPERKERVIEEIRKLPKKEVISAMNNARHYIRERLNLGSVWQLSSTGAHSPSFLGDNPVEYYLSLAITKLFEPTGWDWKFAVCNGLLCSNLYHL